MVATALQRIESDAFRVGLYYIATPSALYRALRKSDEVRDIRSALTSGEITEPMIRDFANGLLAKLRCGESFEYDLTLAALAVALEPRPTPFAEEYIADLAKLDAVELPMSIRVARECVKNRTPAPKPLVLEPGFGDVSPAKPVPKSIIGKESF